MLQKNISLKTYNTFGIDAKASFFANFSSVDDLNTILKERENRKLFILGGGSNILFTKNFDGLVLKNEIQGFKIIQESENFIF